MWDEPSVSENGDTHTPIRYQKGVISSRQQFGGHGSRHPLRIV